MKGTRAENRQPAVQCEFDVSWIDGNVVIDRDRFNPLFALSLAVPSVFSGFVGTLDASGRATATVNVIPPLAGATFHLAAITRDAAAPSGLGAITGALPFRVP